MTRFQPGQSGNPAGRQRGGRNRATLAAEALLDGEAEALTRRAIELALDGETVALRLCLERLIPIRRDRAITFDLPTIETAEDLPRATGAIVAAVATGELTPAEAAEISKTLDVHVRALEMVDVQRRLAALEDSDEAGSRQ